MPDNSETPSSSLVDPEMEADALLLDNGTLLEYILPSLIGVVRGRPVVDVRDISDYQEPADPMES